MKLMIGDDIGKARRRMRIAWIAGFAAVTISFILASIALGGVNAEGKELISGGQYILVTIDSGIIAILSLGLWRRFRVAAVLLFLYFVISKGVLFSVGLGHMGFDEPVIPVQLLFAYLFFQGMRGALTFHHLTHLGPAIAALPREPEAGTDPGV